MSSLPEYKYGTGPEQVDAFFRAKRPWSRVKDKILGDYITCYLRTVPKLRRAIVMVDGFAGPGQFGDGEFGSPLIICDSVTKTIKGAGGVTCLFADSRASHRAALARHLEGYIQRGMAELPLQDCAQAVNRALELGSGSTIFFYLDPYGIKDIEFDMVKQIYERTLKLSTEILLNFNFRIFMRMSGNWNYADSASEISRKVKTAKLDTVNKVMGGDYWIDIITDANLSKIQREDAVVSGYLELVRKYLPFAYSIPVKERDEREHGVPVDELARYHLIFATRSPRAVVYMNDVALNALEPYLRQFKDGLLFDCTPDRYQATDRDRVKSALVDSARRGPMSRPELWEAVIPNFFMEYKKSDYREMVDELVFKEGRLFPDVRAMKSANRLNDDTTLSASPWP